MPRPPVCRRVLLSEAALSFVPVPFSDKEPVLLSRDELEAIRLSDVLGYYQEQAAGEMGVSRATFARILERAHRKVGEALVFQCPLHLTDSAPLEFYEKPRKCGCGRRRSFSSGFCPVHNHQPEEKK